MGKRLVMDQGRAVGFDWNYDRCELFADGVVHALGVGFGLIGAVVITVVAATHATTGVVIAAVAVYALALAAMLACSAAYNMWPVSPTKWILRRFDHSAIYVLIAGTYTPFVTQLKDSFAAGGLLTGLWAAAGVGVVLKLALPGRFDRLSIVLYLLIGWCGVTIWPFIASLPRLIFWLLAAGGALYSVGVVFHVWRGLRFQNAIWHAFVLLAAGCHYAAVLEYAASMRT
jgi:hemolysin III